ncbi:hypothetical protein BUE76_12360 [Cnuella takakiae]|nr:hypothetical protein BUE76_12360 [Cnuella takakiae]
MNSGPPIASPTLQYLPTFNNKVAVLRLDAVHPVVSGNKWYKLQGHLAQAAAAGKRTILTYGGAYSNHIVATAAACATAGLQSVGIIRGEAPEQWSPTLLDAQALGMELHFINRTSYREKTIPEELYKQYPVGSIYVIGEGGMGTAGTTGIIEMMNNLPIDNFTHILSAVGTGTTLAGLIQASKSQQQVLGISSLKDNLELEAAVHNMLPPTGKNNWQINHEFHFGGYAKHKPELIRFMNDWYQLTGVPSDFVYTGKMFYAFQQLWLQQYFPENSNILLVHTGGLQGNRSLPAGTLIY